jgi:hypothetical protein
MDGVGIVLEFGADNFPVVQNLIPGKAAHACSKIIIGDRLIRIGSHPTEYKSFNQVRELIVGPTGSLVTLGFRGVSGEYECENLVRGPLGMEFPTSVVSASGSSHSEKRTPPAGDSATVNLTSILLNPPSYLSRAVRRSLRRMLKRPPRV